MTTMEQAAERWPDWNLWLSRNGGLACATRRKWLTGEEARAGLAPTLIEDDVASLVRRLGEQSDKARRL